MSAKESAVSVLKGAPSAAQTLRTLASNMARCEIYAHATIRITPEYRDVICDILRVSASMTDEMARLLAMQVEGGKFDDN